MLSEPAASPARWIDVAPERFPGWIESFGVRHGVAQDFARQAPGEVARVIAAHAAAGRTVGVLLVRLGGYAAGVFTGAPPRLADSKVGSRLVHGRSAAGGQSQQRFARRREKEGAEALGAAEDAGG